MIRRRHRRSDGPARVAAADGPVGADASAGSAAGPAGALTARSAAGRWVIVATILGSAVASIDATVVTIALPAIGRDLGATFGQLQWVVTGYTLTLAALILLSGGAGDRYGRRRVFLIGLIWFTIASLLCAAAPTVAVLIIARVVQGVGAALLTPASLAIIEASFRPEDRGMAVGTWAAFSGVSAAVAPLIGGWLLSLGTWRWIFLINLPLAAGVCLIVRHVPESRDQEAPRTLDWWGAAMTVVALGALTFTLIGSAGRGAVVTTAGIAVTLGAGAAFLALERRVAAPLLPLGLFRIRQFAAANAVTFLVYAALGVYFLLLVLQLQVVAGWTPTAAGAATIPVTLLTLVLSRPSGALAQRVGPRLQMSLGPAMCCVATLLTLRIGRGASYPTEVLPAVLLFGLGLSTLVAPLTSTALGSLPTANAGLASGVNNAVARTASLLAIAAVPSASGLAGEALTDPAAFAAGFRTAMVVCAGLFGAGALLAALTIQRRIGDETPLPSR
jgi:EmrB/QacA subfamily drug resistance transporter